MSVLSKYKIAISISSLPYTRDLNKHKLVIRIIMYVNLLYVSQKILISVPVICLLRFSISACVSV